MPSHYVSSSTGTIQLYGNTSRTSRVVETLTSSAEITVLKENEGQNCDFHFVSSSANQGYILRDYVFRLPDTPQSAPFVCNVGNVNTSYIAPEWYLLAEDRPYIDQSTLEYCTCVTYNSLSLRGVDEKQIIKQGIIQLCKFYNKAYSDEKIEEYMSYYLFARVVDSYIPYRKFMRVKYLVGIPKKYFDALPEALENQIVAPLQRDLTKANFILKIDLKEKVNLFTSLINILDLYKTDVFFSNSSLVFNEETVTGQNDIFQNPIARKVDFEQKKQNVIAFEQRLDELLNLNGFPSSLENSDINKIEIHFLLNDDCNILYDVAVSINGFCSNLRRGIESFLKSEPVSDPTTINFINNIHNINSVQKCKVPWYEFIELYFYPPVLVLEPIEDSSSTPREIFDKLYNFFLAEKGRRKNMPIMTSKELQDLTNTVNEFRDPKNFLGTIIPFYRLVDQGSTKSPKDLEKVLKDLDKSIDESPIAKDDIYVIETGIFDTTYAIVEKTTSTISGSTGETWKATKAYRYDETILKINTDPASVNIVFEEATTFEEAIQENFTLYKANKAEIAKNQLDKNVLYKIYDFLNRVGFCKLTDVALGCLMSIVRTIASPAEIKTILQISELTNFEYDKMINDIIPYLPQEQQQLIYEQLLIEIGCVNTDALKYILKANLTTEEFRALNVQSASYEQIVTEVAKKMSMSVK
jgi:hypothetical protein